jgi:hypothetical protein
MLDLGKLANGTIGKGVSLNLRYDQTIFKSEN